MSAQLPLVSILIANYNNGQYLEECLESVLNQTYPNFEVVLVDDCSTDGVSRDVYAKYTADHRVRVLHNDRNRGCGFTKEHCIRESSGSFFYFVDPDDKIELEAIDKLQALFMQSDQVSIAYSTHYVCDQDMNPKYVSEAVGAMPAGENNLSYNGPKIGALVGFRRSAYDRSEGLNAGLKRAVDQDLYYKVEEHGRAVFLPEPLYYYRYHENGISTTNNLFKAYYWHLLVMEDTMRRRKGSTVRSMSPETFDGLRMGYYQERMAEKFAKSAFCSFIFYFGKSLPYLRYDRRMNGPRMLVRLILKKLSLR